MKRFFSYLMVMAILVLGGGKAMAQSVTIGGVVYSVDGDHAYVSGNDGIGDTVVVLGAVTIDDVEYPVTEIAANAFSNQSDLVSVTLPDDIVTIGNSAFESCSNLISVNIGKGIVSIGDFTFRSCRKLTNIVLPDGLKSIGSYTFSTCESFTDIKVPDGVNEFGGCVFEYCYNLTSITLPKGITILPGHTFWDCNSLISIVIPEGITTIELETFYSCESLSTVVLPNSLTNIDTRAFYDCYSLKKVINNSSLPIEKGSTDYGYVAYYAQEIVRGDTCINNCWFYTDDNGVHHLTYYEGTDSAIVLPSDYQGGNYCINDNVFSGHDEIVSVQIPEAVTSIGASAFYNCTNMTSITIPSSVVYIGEYAFSGCTSLPIENGIRYADCYAIEVVDKTLSEYTLKDNVRFFGDELFKDCSVMTSVNIPSGVTSIGDNTFYGCSALASLSLPETVASIGAQAFYNCSSLTSVNIPSGVTSIGDNTFYGCSALTSLALPETVASIGVQAFYNCSFLASVNIPSGVTSIGDYTFYGCSALAAITIPASITSIGNHAFEGCTGLKELTIADGNELLHLGHNNTSYGGQFTSCSLNKLYLGRNLSWDYGHSPFNGITTLKEVIVGDCVTDIGVNLFYNCSSLASIHLSENITSIGGSAFSNCGALTYIHCGFESPEILYGKGLREQAAIYVPEGTYVAYKELFPNNTIIDGETNEVTIDITVPGTLGEEVLSQVAYIRDVNSLKVSGTLNDDDLATITGSMVNLLHLDLSKTNLTSVSGVGQANLCSIVFPDSCKAIYGYSERDNLTTITLPDAVETIGNICFSGCNNLTEVTMSANLKTVEDYSFNNCPKLTSVTFMDGDKSIGSYAFQGCSNLTSVSFGDGDKSIGSYAFQSCSNLTSVSFGDGHTSIGYYAFWWCSNLKKIVIDGSISCKEYGAFSGCSNITEVHIPDIESWLLGSFYNDTSSIPNGVSSNVTLYIDGKPMTEIEIPSSVTSIRPYAFYQIKGITSVTIPEGVTNIGDNAFAGCDSLRSITIPSTLTYCGVGTFGGGGFEEITCPAFFPPITGGDLIGANNCTLYVPEWTLNRYKLANNWNLFASIEPISGIYPNSISVYTEESLTIPTEGLAADYKPNMEIVRYDNNNIGRFTVRGEGTLPLTSFKMQQTRDANTMTSLVNYGTLTADNVVTDLNISTNTWHFLTFPYDVKVSDIATVGNWVISRYDGEARAKEDFGNTWKTLPYDSILHAGEGYIWHSQGGNFTVPAIDNENKNLIFANDTRYIQLKENPAATDANYGWNLIGNPYPCFYDTRFMDFTSPITVRSGSSYAAYSPVDDSYILSPLEAFFVQCSAESNVVGFYTEGRQTDNTVRTLTSAPTTRTASERSVLNLYLENGNYADHTRLVVNEGASLAYEIACDAAKFMSDDAAVQQLFTIEGGERMAINERPLANGKAALGVYIGKAGSYTLSLDTKAMDTEVLLVDKLQGTETDLTNGSYAFTAEASTFTDRFEIHMKRTGVVDGIEAVAAELKIEATADGISVSNATTPIYIYSATGALVDTKVGSAVIFDVPQGVYVVKVGDNVHKVVVK